MLSTDAIGLDIQTLIEDERGEPKVVMILTHTPTGNIIVPVSLSTVEARTVGSWLLQAAEVAEADAQMVKALRTAKMPEEEIMHMLKTVRANRGKEVTDDILRGSTTVEE